MYFLDQIFSSNHVNYRIKVTSNKSLDGNILIKVIKVANEIPDDKLIRIASPYNAFINREVHTNRNESKSYLMLIRH
jgi:hypothetical protein